MSNSFSWEMDKVTELNARVERVWDISKSFEADTVLRCQVTQEFEIFCHHYHYYYYYLWC